jgi:hypothetical protein
MAGATGLRFNFNKSEAPLFERMSATDELHNCRQVIDALQSRVQDLERINTDLEMRLEDQAKQCMAVETECIEVDRNWKDKYMALQKQVDEWKNKNATQEMKTNKLREHLSRTEKELYGILQRKYELMRGPGRAPGQGPGGGGPLGPGGPSGPGGGGFNSGPGGGGSGGGGAGGSRGGMGESRNSIFQEEAYSANQARQPQEIRQRRMVSSLHDFLGL